VTAEAGSSRREKPHPRGAVVSDAAWVEPLRLAALAVFIGLLAVNITVPWIGGRLTWTVAIAGLPLFFVVVGYHRWRRICPLAFVAQLPTRLGRAGQRRAGRWLQANGYRMAFAVFLLSLWLRLVATNGDGHALATFLVAACLAAVVIGLVYTGKTWCNYVCPVSFVEKLYTEPRGLHDTPNSQCATCTACKPACPDINQENSYWKEILQPGKRQVFYAFPGVVLAFYAYYYLQSGTWAYYFDGSWTNEPGVAGMAFLPGVDAATAGLFFWPEVPRALAAALTLGLGGAVSLATFAALERGLGPALRARELVHDDAGVRNVMFTLAAFTAFIGFYAFAGAPTLRLVPGLTHSFQVVVVAVGTLCLARRVGRRQSTFAEETLARRIIANWQWTDTPPPRDLREAFLIHTIRSQSHEEARERLLGLYTSAVRDAVGSGVVSRSDVGRLESLRNQMHISASDHERVMALLAEEEETVETGVWAMSPEKQLQLETYGEALAVHLERQHAAGGALDDALIRELRAKYGVTGEEHAGVLDHLMSSREGVAAHLIDAPASIEVAALTVTRLAVVRSPVARFLEVLFTRRWRRAADGLLQALAGESDRIDEWRAGLTSTEPADRDAAVAALGVELSEAVTARLADGQRQARQAFARHEAVPDVLRIHLTSPDPYIRATAYFLLESLEAATDADREQLADDDHPIISDVLTACRSARVGDAPAESSVVEKMIGLKSIAILDDLEPEDLAQLARAGTESWFREGEALCREGEMSDDVFVLLAGEVSIVRADGDAEHVLGVEGPGSCIGELAVLDPAPRGATVVASTVAVRTLRLTGRAFRAAVSASPLVSESITRMLVRRLRRNAGSNSEARK
jgi:hypothetical protein